MVVITISEWTLRSQLRRNPADQHRFVYSNAYRIGCVVFAGMVLYTNYLMLVRYAYPGLEWEIARFVWLFATLPMGWYLVRDAFLFSAMPTENELVIYGIRGVRRLAWRDIQSVCWQESSWGFQITTQDTRVRVGVFVDGIAELLEQVRRSAPEVDMTAAQAKIDQLRG